MRSHLCLTLLALAALALVAGCDGELTEILVVVDTDLEVPDEIDSIRVQVTGTETMTASGDLVGDDAIPLPRTVGLVRNGSSLGPIEVRVVGARGGVDVVERRVTTSFIEGRTLVLPMFLARNCRGVSCGDGETCGQGACEPASVDPAQLEEHGGDVARLDGGCAISPEICNGTDEDCDGRIDEDFDLDTDPLNCGACFQSCMRTNAVTECRGGDCAVTGCDSGFGDCNADPLDGCESSLDSPAHCGACDSPCAFPNATGDCAGGACALGACDDGFADCNADPADGCEAPLTTLTDCGGCGVACALADGTATCATGTCVIETCNAGLGDCDADPTDCETSLDTLTDCGGCGVTCDVADGTETCATGTCEIDTCDAGFGDCNADPADGCETALVSLTDCGGCGIACSVTGGTATCATGTCAVDTCNANLGDCNTDASDGCETDLRFDDAHCGMCGNACPVGDTCRPSGCG